MLVTKTPLQAERSSVNKKTNATKRSAQVTMSLDDGKPMVVSRNGGNLTPLGGLPLLRKVERMFKLVEGATGRLKDHRTVSLIEHNIFDAVFGRVSQIAAGLPDANDADLVRKDAGLKKALGRDPEEGLDGPSQPTYSRFENAVDEKDLKALSDWLIEYYIKTHPKPPRRILLYCDGSAVQTYGDQQGSVYRGGKYNKQMFFPLFVFDHTGWLLFAELREGDQGEVKRGKTALVSIIKKLQAAWPSTKIGVRADAAFASPKLFKWFEAKGVDYAIGIAGNFAIASIAVDYHRMARKKFKHKHGEPVFAGLHGKRKKQKIHATIKRMQKDRRKDALDAWHRRRVRVYGEVSYRARTWHADRRIICRCDYTDNGLECRYVVTNIEGNIPENIYEKEYCPHANVERSLKEFKNGLLLRLSCEKYTANAFRLYLHGFSYQLLYHLRQFLKPALQKLSIESIRKMFITTAVKVSCSERRVYWALSDTYAYAVDFLNLCRKLARAG
jgi:Transposase DDE domain group 1